jgi:transposase
MLKMDEAAKRRVRAARLLQKGEKPAVVAEKVGAPRQTVYRWLSVLNQDGIEALRVMSKGGRPGQLSPEQKAQLSVMLIEGPLAHGYPTDLWTLKRVRLLIEKTFDVHFSDVHVWRLLGALGFSSQKPEKQARERDDQAVDKWKKRTWPALKKKPAARAG